ncbi:MAG: HEAT repeat domain-containing protein, partial [Candidatus Omnitrophota bacterium]
VILEMFSWPEARIKEAIRKAEEGEEGKGRDEDDGFDDKPSTGGKTLYSVVPFLPLAFFENPISIDSSVILAGVIILAILIFGHAIWKYLRKLGAVPELEEEAPSKVSGKPLPPDKNERKYIESVISDLVKWEGIHIYNTKTKMCTVISGQAKEILIKIGTPAVEYLIDTLTGRFTPPFNPPKGVERTESKRAEFLSYTRAAAAEVLGKIKDRKAVIPLCDVLSGVLKDKDGYVRAKAAEALGKIKDCRAENSLLAALDDELASIQENAIYALGNFRGSRVVKGLISAFAKVGDTSALSGPLSATIKKALLKIGEDSIGPLTKALAHENSKIRDNALEILLEMSKRKPEKVTFSLLFATHDKNDKLRETAKGLLKIIKSRVKRTSNILHTAANILTYFTLLGLAIYLFATGNITSPFASQIINHVLLINILAQVAVFFKAVVDKSRHRKVGITKKEELTKLTFWKLYSAVTAIIFSALFVLNMINPFILAPWVIVAGIIGMIIQVIVLSENAKEGIFEKKSPHTPLSKKIAIFSPIAVFFIWVAIFSAGSKINMEIKPVEELLRTMQSDLIIGTESDIKGILIHRRGKKDVQALFGGLTDSERWVRERALEVLEGQGWEPDNDYERVCYLLARERTDEIVDMGEGAVTHLLKIFRNNGRSEFIQMGVIKALGDIGGDSAFGFIVFSTGNSKEKIREAAVLALEKMGDKRSVDALVGLLSSKNRWTRRNAAESLDRLKWQPADQDQQILYLIAAEKWEDLARVGETAIPFLEKMEEDGNDIVRGRGAITIRMIRGKITDLKVQEAIDVLETTGEVRLYDLEEATKKIGKTGEARFVPLLIRNLSRWDDLEVKQTTVRAIMAIGKPAVP